MRKLFICMAVMALIHIPLSGQATDATGPEVKPGALARDIACRDDGDAYYHVYLPKEYNKNKKYPVLFFFGPAFDMPIEKYLPAADEKQWILVSAFPAVTGPWRPVLDYQKALHKEFASGRYSIDVKRMYACGTRQGSAMACTMAFTFPDNFSGIIAINGGLGHHHKPLKGMAAYCMIGLNAPGVDQYTDYMNTELIEKLREMGVDCTLEKMLDAADWPDKSEDMARAMDWLDFRYFAASPKCMPDERAAFLDLMFKQGQDLGKDIKAYELYGRIALHFKDKEIREKALKLMNAVAARIPGEVTAQQNYLKLVQRIQTEQVRELDIPALKQALSELGDRYKTAFYGKKAKQLSRELNIKAPNLVGELPVVMPEDEALTRYHKRFVKE